MKKLVTIVASAGLALGVSACGGGGEANGPEQAVQTYSDAVLEQDYATMCDTVDPKLVKTLEEAQGGKKCADIFKENEEAFTKSIPEDAEINVKGSKIAEDGKTATVTVEDQDGKTSEVQLVKVEEEWKITFE